jgi:predicted  nucleic acid-binding Zn ribbon protein
MYLGITTVAQKTYREKYFPGIGTRSVYAGASLVLRHSYTCDHCGQRYAFDAAAEEPFYCHSHSCKAVRLVSIGRAPA